MITGRTTRLRRIEPRDVDDLLRWQSDPAVMRWWGQLEPLVVRGDLERDVTGRFSQPEHALYLMIETPAGKPIGRLDVDRIDARHRTAEIGIYLGEVGEHGKGYGADAMAAVCRYLFRQRGIHRIALTSMTGNDRALSVYERLGFRREGTLRRHLWMDGEPVDEVAMSLLEGELREGA